MRLKEDCGLNKGYVDQYEDMTGRIDVICPYCGGLHSVLPKVYSWGCRLCGGIFKIPKFRWSNRPIEGKKLHE